MIKRTYRIEWSENTPDATWDVTRVKHTVVLEVEGDAAACSFWITELVSKFINMCFLPRIMIEKRPTIEAIALIEEKES